eukprot:7643662-Pyramimonas_sp.AAC.2
MPSPCFNGGWSLTWRNNGNTKARVLPEPVLAMPMQSRPLCTIHMNKDLSALLGFPVPVVRTACQ